MEYLDGLDLDRLVRAAGPLEPPRAIHILVQVAGALAEAHALGLIHRDIKPANIYLLDPDPRRPPDVRVIDFGVAKANEEGCEGLTRAGAILGTPAYMAPEQLRARTVDARVDIYAAGATPFETCTGLRSTLLM